MPSLASSTLVAAIVVTVVVEVLLLASTFRMHRQAQPEAGSEGGTAPPPNIVTEALWTLVPALFLALLFLAGLQQ